MLNATGLASGNGVSHHWEENIGGTWTPISGATSSSLTVSSISANTDYRFVSSCSHTSSDAYSNVVTVAINPSANCMYCVATNLGGSQITNVTIATTAMNNTTGGASGPTFYNNFAPTGSATADLIAGNTYTISTTYDAATIGSVWIDFDHDTVYEANEWVQLGTTGTSHSVSIMVPLSATTGVTGMRVRSRSEGNTNGAVDACLAMGSGETEDYLVTILPLAGCSGTPVAGAINAPTVSSCPGVDIMMNLTGQTIAGGIDYEWQSSPAGGTNWQPISGATTDHYTIVGGVSAVTDYRVKVTCSNGGAFDMTVPITISPLSPTQCYCTPSYATGCSADDDINTLILTGENGTGINDVNTGCSPNSYDDRTTVVPPVQLAQGGAYNGEISSNYTGTEYMQAWIDFGDDGVFDATDAIGTASDFGDVLVPFTFNIPSTGATGMHRMRVRMAYNVDPATDIDPCIEYNWGETHDYMVSIVAPCPPMSLAVSTASNSVCEGSSVMFTATPTNAGATPMYHWMVNGTEITGETGDTYITASLVNGDVVSATVMGSCIGAGTVASNDVTMTVNAPVTPTVSANTSAPIVCNNGTATLTAVETNGGSSPAYQWYVNGTAIPGATESNHTASGITDGDEFYVEMTSSETCVISAMATSSTIVMSTYPSTASITADGPTTICTAGGSVTLTASAGTDYLWSNGDVTQSITVTPATAATFTVSVTNANGCVDQSAPVTVTAKTMPNTAKIKVVGSATACAPGTVALVMDMAAGTTTGFAYQWNIDGTPIPGATDSTYSADATGAYTLTISGGGTCSKTSAAKAATVKPTPTADFTTTGATTFCSGAGSVTFDAVPVSGATYTWRKNGTNNAGSGPTKTFTAAGEYTLIVTLNGCKDTSDYSETITVNPLPPTPKIIVMGSSTVCEPFTVPMELDSAIDASGLSFQWNMDGSPIAGANDSTYTADTTGLYTITLTTTEGCSKTSGGKKATVKPLPVADFTTGGPTEFCQGGSVTLTAPNHPGYSYKWITDAGASAGSGAAKVAKSSGTYLLVAMLAGCKDTSDYSETVTVNALPVANIATTDPATFCAGDSATLMADPSAPGFTYMWKMGSTMIDTTSSSEYEAKLAGYYYVMVTDTNGCTSKMSTSKVVVKINAIPVAVITAQGSTTISATGSVKLKATPTGTGITYQWYLDGVAIANATGKEHIATTGGDYTVEVTKAGCMDISDATTVTQTTVKEEDGTTSNPAGTEEAGSVFELSAFPNPVSGVLNINVRGIEEVDAVLHVMDMNGKLVAVKEMHEASATVDMTSYASGMYLIRYKDNHGRTGTIKVSKQ